MLSTVLAVDIGAESGRVIAGHFDGQHLRTDELYRFANVPVRVRDTLHWDILRLWNDVQTGIGKAAEAATSVAAIGIDTWAIDFGLLDRAGHLLGNPVHYRDSRTQGIADYVFSQVPRQEVFAHTGIQILPFNSLYQLVSMVRNNDPMLGSAARLLTVPDLLYYWLTGVQVNEFTNATTTQCYDTQARGWAFDLMEQLGIPTQIFGAVSQPGQILGHAGQVPVVLTPHHDTACAVVGVPALGGKQGENFAYISSGTWSLLGVELPDPIVNDAALAANITNEGGYGNTTRLLKNIMGLWLIQESRRTWASEGHEYSYSVLADLAHEATPLHMFVDPDDASFLLPGDMPARIREYCKRTGQLVPDSIGTVTRCIFESLALKYRYVLNQIQRLTGRHIDTIHIVGGGAQNALLCQMTADATGCHVLAGPVEATALGNIVVQLIALGELGSVDEGRALIRDSFPLMVYEPCDTDRWLAVESRFNALVEGK